MRSAVLVVLMMALVTLPIAAGAQDRTSLEDVEELARLGRTEEARVTLLSWWQVDRIDASRRDLQPT